MDRIGRPIFRGEALRRYIDRQAASVYPKLLARYKSIWLWSALAFLITAFILVISIRVPRQLSCLAVSTEPGRGEFMLLLKTGHSTFVSPGCEAVLEIEANGRVIRQVTLLENPTWRGLRCAQATRQDHSRGCQGLGRTGFSEGCIRKRSIRRQN